MDTTTSFTFALKETYSGQVVQNMMYQNRPLFALLPKAENFGGKVYPQPVIVESGQGFSATFQNAQLQQTNVTGSEFLMTVATDYGVATLTRLLMKQSGSDVYAFLDASETQMKTAINGLANRLAWKSYRDTFGVIGQLSSTSGVTTSLTLLNQTDIVNFSVGQTLVASTQSNGTALKTGTLQITNINRGTGVITVSPSGATLSPVLAVSDFLYVAGDATLSLAGLAAWLPTSDPTSTAFFGVDRTVDIQRLSGVRANYTDRPTREALIDFGQQIYIAGGQPDYAFMNPVNYGRLLKSLETTKLFVDVPTEAGVSFKALQFEYQAGVIKILPDRFCPINLNYWLSMDTWKLRSLGPAPEMVEEDGVTILRSPNSDSFEVRWAFYGNLMSNAPGWSGICQIQ